MHRCDMGPVSGIVTGGFLSEPTEFEFIGMSEFGTKRTCLPSCAMSGFGGTADIAVGPVGAKLGHGLGGKRSSRVRLERRSAVAAIRPTPTRRVFGPGF